MKKSCFFLLLALQTSLSLATAVIQTTELIPVKGRFKTQNDPTDIYLPSSAEKRLPVLVILQGAQVDKSHYSTFAIGIAKKGAVVAVANHHSFLGKNYTSQKVVESVWKTILKLNQTRASALFGMIDSHSLFVLGHSYGGIAAMNLAAKRCQPPTCFGKETTPKALRGSLTFGFFNHQRTDNQVPVMMLQGSLDDLKKAQKTFQRIANAPKYLMTILGANHFAITNENNPTGAIPDKAEPELDQTQGLDLLASLTHHFITAFSANASLDAPKTLNAWEKADFVRMEKATTRLDY